MRHFKPKIWTTIATVVVCPLLFSLGLWQLDRAEQKRELARQFELGQQRTPGTINAEVLQPEKARLWFPVTGHGEYLSPLVLLDNRIREGRAGYEVLSPMKTESGVVVLVNRGWVPVGENRDAVPAIETPAKITEYSGNIGPPPASGIAINESSHEVETLAPNFFRVQRVNPAQLAALFQIEMAANVLYLDSLAPAGLQRDWSKPGFSPEKHEAYATQWFIMSLIVLGLYGGLNWRNGD